MGTSKSRIAKVVLGLLLITGLASAGLEGSGDGESRVMSPAPCMSELFKAKGGGGGLNCTSNDIRVAGVAPRTVVGPNGEPVGSPDLTTLPYTTPGDTAPHTGCRYEGDKVRFKARFNLLLSATARYDIGIFFAVDGDTNGDGAYTSDPDVKPFFNPQKAYVSGGGCVAATPAYSPNAPNGSFFDLDQAVTGQQGDLCGDIAGNNPLQPEVEIITECIRSTSDPSKLKLPVCLSWRQPGANALCLTPEDAYPGAPSKCNCDTGFTVPINIPAGTITVTKTPDVETVKEPGGPVTFKVTIKNDAGSTNPAFDLTVTTIMDNVFGDVTSTHLASSNTGAVTFTNCNLLVGTVLSGGEKQECAFTGVVTGNGGGRHTNVVTGTVVDSEQRSISDDAEASVLIEKVNPYVDITKTASPDELTEPGGNVTFTVTVTNPAPPSVPSSVEPIFLTSLTDTDFGDIFTLGAEVPGTVKCVANLQLDVGQSCTRRFVKMITGQPGAGPEHENVATVVARDDEGTNASDSDNATVNIVDDTTTIDVTKTANPTIVSEPGGNVTFTVTIKNESAIDFVTINSVTDVVNGVPRTINCLPSPLGSYAPLQTKTCTFSANVTGNAGYVENDTVTAIGIDDDGKTVTDNADAMVTVQNTAPAATLTKTVESAIVKFKVVISNNSNSQDPIKLNSLVDVVDGVPTDITVEGGRILDTTCQTGGTIQPGGPDYECTFDALVTESQIDTVTGKLKDNDNTEVSPEPSDSAEVKLVD